MTRTGAPANRDRPALIEGGNGNPHAASDGDGSGRALRPGWTTGSCATAATKAAFTALATGTFPDPVTITLPGGREVAFALAFHRFEPDGRAVAAVVKDAGDDPDVTHGAVVVSSVARGVEGAGVRFAAGAGVGTVTRAGLPIPPGEPAINPVPRAMMRTAIAEVASAFAVPPDADIEISILDGERLAESTLNGRLGIVGGLSVLGTTGIVVPYSCAAWIHSIHRGVDVARAAGLGHIAGSTGSTSEAAVRALYGFDDMALIDMGDFVGGLLKYLKTHPVPRLTIAGGPAKITKLAQGRLDLHSKRGEADLGALAAVAVEAGSSAALATRITGANTVLEAFGHAAAEGIALADAIAESARATAEATLAGLPIAIEVVVFDRTGSLIGRAPFRSGG